MPNNKQQISETPLKFSIIIVSWNALHHLKVFLPTVVKTGYPDFEIILADNASTDNSRKWVTEQYKSVKVVTFNKNYGYCGGNNRAVPYASGNILVFLNNDVKVDSNWLNPLAEMFQKNEEIAAVQPKIRSYKNPVSFEYAGAAGGFIDKYGFPFCRGRIFDTVEKDTGQYDEDVDIFWASGAALAVRKPEFEQAGGFDEDFKFHMEEIDLCWRLWNAGYRIRSCTKSVVYHLGGGSLPMHSHRKLYYNYRNSLTTLWKNYASTALFMRFFVRLYLDLIASLRELFKGNLQNFRAIFRAHFHFWGELGKTNAKRKKLQALRKYNRDPEVMYKKSIVDEYFFKNKKYYREL